MMKNIITKKKYLKEREKTKQNRSENLDRID